MPLRVVLNFKSPDGAKYDSTLSIKVPKKFWAKESKHLVEWFVEFYNGKHADKKLDPQDMQLVDKDGSAFPLLGVIQESFSHKQEIGLRVAPRRAPQKDDKDIKDGKIKSSVEITATAVTLNSVVDMEDPVAFAKAEEVTEAQYKTYKKNHGLKSELTLKVAFRLLDICIGQYKLDRCTQILEEVKEACASEETKSEWYTRYIQSKAFCLWKQSKFKEALVLFEEMTTIVGKSSKLLENMGHTHNSLGQYKKAQECFEEALALVDIEKALHPESDTHKGGLHMGLGLVKKRQGDVKGGLEDLKKSLEWYIESTGPKPHSLVAKAHMAVGHAYEDLKEFKAAVSHMEKGVDIFQRTCGSSSPLTGNAQGSLGKLYLELNSPERAWNSLAAALKNEVKHDSLNVFTIFEHANLLYQIASKKLAPKSDPTKLVDSLVYLDSALGPQMKSGLIKRDGNIGALYKSMAELAIVANHYKLSSKFLDKALTHFGEEKNFDCSTLIKECRQVLSLVADLIRKGMGY
ncbi:hypothetical protein AAMO2058_000015300 [Amorphochlora amoebiformis]|eukprot:573639-Amorphochlora_amoeboformis.AAC.1